MHSRSNNEESFPVFLIALPFYRFTLTVEILSGKTCRLPSAIKGVWPLYEKRIVMMFRRFLLAASVSLLSLNAEAGEITFNTTTDTFLQSDDSISTFAVDGGDPQVTTENGVKVFTFDSIILSNDTVTVTGDAPLIVRSRTNFEVIDSVVNVVAGNAGGGTRGDRGEVTHPLPESTGGAGGDGGSGQSFVSRSDGLEGEGSQDASPANAGLDGGDGFGGTAGGTGGAGGATALGQSIAGTGGARGTDSHGAQGGTGLTGNDGGDGENGAGGANTVTGRTLSGGGGGGGGGAGANGSGGSGGGGGGGADRRPGGPFSTSFSGGDGGSGGQGGNGKIGVRGGHGGAGGGAVAFEALGLLKVVDSALSADGANGGNGRNASNARLAGEQGEDGESPGSGYAGGKGGNGGAGGLGGDGGDGGGGAGGTIKLSASIVDIQTSTDTNIVSAKGGEGQESGATGRFIIESNTDTNLNNVGTLFANTELFSGNRDINPFILGDVETPLMIFGEDVGGFPIIELAGFLSDTTATDLFDQNVIPEFPLDAIGALVRLDTGFGGGNFVGFDVLLFANLTEEVQSGARFGIDPLSQGTGFLADIELDMAGLSVFATLIPENGTTFSALFADGQHLNFKLENGQTNFIVPNIPVPAALPLMATAIVGMVFVKHRKRRKSK